MTGRAVVQKHGERYLVQNPPALPLTTEELDAVAELPYERYYHPIYEEMEGVPAIKEVEFPLPTTQAALEPAILLHAFHRALTSPPASTPLCCGAERFTHNPHFKGYIHDVGGPTANFRAPSCAKQATHGLCR